MKHLALLTIALLMTNCGKVRKSAQELATVNCHMQSPVNIVPGQEIGSSHKVLVHYESSSERVANLGHTVEVEYDSGSYITYDGIDYQFKQFHFHTPSEHQINAASYAMEMHIVHTYEGVESETPQYLVVGVFFMEGDESEFLASFLDAVPDQEGEVYESGDKVVNAAEMLPERLSDFYNYRGSLTTPPYTESVNWIVLKEPKKASSTQLSKIKQIEGENARGVQVLYDRVVESIN